MPSTDKKQTRRVRVHLQAAIDFDVKAWGEEGQKRLRGAVMDRIARMGAYVSPNGFERFPVVVYTINLDTEVIVKPKQTRIKLNTGQTSNGQTSKKG